jgi:mono/diheme cytochrome c family protein
MKGGFLMLAVAVLAPAQDIVKQGEGVFNKSCAIGYCHGSRGTAGGAPRLAARGFDQAFINSTVQRGLSSTAMPAFGAVLSRADLTAVVAYVASLNGVAITAPAIAATPATRLSGDAGAGLNLFSDAVRSFGRCSTCHQVGGLGIAVATPIANVPADAAALKALATPQVSTVMIGSDSMPALMVGKKANAVMFYDLTSSPPVLRTELPAAVQTRDGSTWKHFSAIGSYSDAELTMILAYLRAVVKP